MTLRLLLDWLISTDADWMVDAACRGLDPDLFFPTRGEPLQQARDVCAACPVRDECLAYAQDNRIKFGMWGGQAERQRRTGRPPESPHGTVARFKRCVAGPNSTACRSCRDAENARKNEWARRKKLAG